MDHTFDQRASRWQVDRRLLAPDPVQVVTVQANITVDLRDVTAKQTWTVRDPHSAVEFARAGHRPQLLELAVIEANEQLADLWCLLKTWWPNLPL